MTRQQVEAIVRAAIQKGSITMTNMAQVLACADENPKNPSLVRYWSILSDAIDEGVVEVEVEG
jgi:hypothetical protein